MPKPVNRTYKPGQHKIVNGGANKECFLGGKRKNNFALITSHLNAMHDLKSVLV